MSSIHLQRLQDSWRALPISPDKFRSDSEEHRFFHLLMNNTRCRHLPKGKGFCFHKPSKGVILALESSTPHCAVRREQNVHSKEQRPFAQDLRAFRELSLPGTGAH